jgi:dTDP-4-amino-4,6-dideoxygalactose transaminase
MFDDFIRLVREIYQTDDFIPLHEPRFVGNEKQYLLDVIDSTFVSSVGPYVGEFESKIAGYCGVKHAVATVNGTAALHVALLLAGVNPGDEVITQAVTFVATCNAIDYCGAEPVFVDVDKTTLGLSPQALEDFLQQFAERRDDGLYNRQSDKRIAGCLPMHSFGHSCDMAGLLQVCEQFGIALIEDAAEALGSFLLPTIDAEPKDIVTHNFSISLGKDFSVRPELVEGWTEKSWRPIAPNHSYFDILSTNGLARKAIPGSCFWRNPKHCGTLGKLGVLSFNGNKIITTGGGGMILTDDDELARQAKHLTTTAKLPHAWRFEHDQVGYNYRMPNLNAALGLAQLEQLPAFLDAKRRLAQRYLQWGEQHSVAVVAEPEFTRSNYWLNALLLDNAEQREQFLEFTNANGVMTRPLWQLMHELTMYRHCQHDHLTNSRWLAERLVNIPSSVVIT